MKLHLDKTLFQEAIQATAQHIGIPEVYVKKDYWISLTLFEIFSSDISDLVVCKGGTCLSKCYNLIQRFSEDRDVILPSKVRHIYDLHLMLKNEDILSFF